MPAGWLRVWRERKQSTERELNFLSSQFHFGHRDCLCCQEESSSSAEESCQGLRNAIPMVPQLLWGLLNTWHCLVGDTEP